MLKKMLETIFENNLISKGDKVIVGLSGGPDSLAMIHALHYFKETLGIELVAVHINHMFRGTLADLDEAFVNNFCVEMKIPLYSYKIDVSEYAKEVGTSFEDAGRRIRYEYFKKVMILENGQKIAVAQNKNDLIETFFINLFRGAGIDGLASIDYIREDVYIRPILDVERSLIESYCLENQLVPRRDHTNDENDYLRNKIRNELIPHLKKTYNPSLDETLYKTIQIMKKEKSFWKSHTEKLFKTLCDEENGRILISKKGFDQLEEAEKIQLIRVCIQSVKGNLTNISSKMLNRIKKLNKTGAVIELDMNYRVKLSYDALIVEPYSFEREDEVPVVFSICLSKEKYEAYAQSLVGKVFVAVDASKISGVLHARHRKEGDTFQPLGMQGHKKIKNFFIDEKIPAELREQIWLVCDEDQIVWVYGYRMNEKCRISAETENILLISFENIVEELELC